MLTVKLNDAVGSTPWDAGRAAWTLWAAPLSSPAFCSHKLDGSLWYQPGVLKILQVQQFWVKGRAAWLPQEASLFTLPFCCHEAVQMPVVLEPGGHRHTWGIASSSQESFMAPECSYQLCRHYDGTCCRQHSSFCRCGLGESMSFSNHI